MKKTYKKPMIFIEDFAVTESIAAGTMSCAFKMSKLNKNAADCDIEDWTLNNYFDMGAFRDGMDCSYMLDIDEYNKICYHGAVMMS